LPDYVYGIVESGATAPRGDGVAGARVRVVGDDGTAALVSDVAPRRLELGRDEVLSHARVLEEALQNGTVLPMRFGVVLEGDEDVKAQLLEPHAAELREQLTRFSGRVEINIRATYEEEIVMREILAENPAIATLREAIRDKPEDATYYERIELGERVAEAIERKRELDGRQIVSALSVVSDAVEVSAPAHERVALSASFLVARDRLKDFDEVLEAFAEGQGGRLRFKYTGPLPPHSFVEFAGAG
jgi:gas vesicle protein GvpL/GvpF